MRPLPSSGIEHTAIALHDDIRDEDAFLELLVALTIDECADAIEADDKQSLGKAMAKYARLVSHRSPEQIVHLERTRGLIA